MSLDILSQQITCLLGHNGAGKTTTMNMITGIYPPSSGKILVNGYDVSTATREARKSIGYCPQENILFNDLSVEQHLQLYAVLKDIPSDKIGSEITRVLTIIRLSDKRHWKSSLLSGGMKRKLSLGIAIIGTTEVLILDEPTSGMDPEARRAIWDVLQHVRREKTILLTTHYMEEADILGDRIAIMSEGVLKCCGSPMFLKKRFGAGYHLRIAKTDNYNKESVDTTLKKYLPDSRLQSEINTEVIYSLESDDRSKQTDKNIFPKLFDELESRKQELGFNSFGITVTTMEDVFLKVGSYEEVDNGKKGSQEKIEKQYKNEDGFKLIQMSVLGLLVKRFHYSRRHWAMLLFQIVIPAVLFILVFLADNSVKSVATEKSKSITLDLQELYGRTIGFYHDLDPTTHDFGAHHYIPNAERHGITANILTKQTDPKDWLLEKSRDFEQYVMKYVLGGAVSNTSGTLRPQIWFNYESTHSLPLSINLMYESLVRQSVLKLKDFTITTIVEPLKSWVFTGSEPLKSWVFTGSGKDKEYYNALIQNMMAAGVSCVLLMPITLPFLAASYLIYPIIERVSKSKALQLMTGLSSAVYWLSNYLFDILNHLLAITLLSLVVYMFDVNQAFFKGWQSGTAFFLLLLAFGLSSISIAYCLSFWFNSSPIGFSLLLVFYLVFGFIVNAIYSGLYLITTAGAALAGPTTPMGTTQEDGFMWLIHAFRLIPIFSLNYGFTKIYMINVNKQLCAKQMDAIRESSGHLWPSNTFPTEWPDQWPSFFPDAPLYNQMTSCKYLNPLILNPAGIGRELIGLTVSALLFIIVLLIIE
ncbi:unnamed protein product, partial [Medioppia subpectinata]